MDTDQLEQAVETARSSGMTSREALIHWDLAGGLDAGEKAAHWAVIAIDLAMTPKSARSRRTGIGAPR